MCKRKLRHVAVARKVTVQSIIASNWPHLKSLIELAGSAIAELLVGIRVLWRSTTERQRTRMSKVKNGALDQYDAGPFEQQQFRPAGIAGVNKTENILRLRNDNTENTEWRNKKVANFRTALCNITDKFLQYVPSGVI